MKVNFDTGHRLELSFSDKVKSPLVVSSHERSGTHFLINSLNQCTEYTSTPYLDFDYHSLGTTLNFFFPDQIKTFFNSLTSFQVKQKICCINSIIKSHFDLRVFSGRLPSSVKILYIYRDPVEVLLSFWKYSITTKYFLAPKSFSPLEFAMASPSGLSQRYQFKNYKSYFDRWANHVQSAYLLSLNNPNIYLINYTKLCSAFSSILKESLVNLSIPLSAQPKVPVKEFYFHGADIQAEADSIEKLKIFCRQSLLNYNNLPIDILAD